MLYVEMLRARNTIKWTLFGLLVLTVATVSLGALFPGMHYDPSQQPPALLVVGWIAALVTAIVVSIFGISLSTENCGHLEIAWTKPMSRTARALGMFAIDLAALVIIFGMTFAAAYVAASFLGGHLVRVTFDQQTFAKLGRFVIFPVAWFGMLQGLTSGIRGKQAGWVVGMSWPIAEGLSLLGVVSFAAPLHSAIGVLNFANPIAYYPFWTIDEGVHHGVRPFFGFGLTTDLLALAAIAIVGMVVATLTWRRLEA
jgi:hypothetical protein